jgi:aspergillopepsin I
MAYTPVDNSDGFWTFTSSGYGIGTDNFSATRIVGIADTGTTLLLLPSSVVKAYYSRVTGAKNDRTQGGYVFPCNAKLPTFTFGVGESRIAIPGSYANFAPLEDGSSTCFGGIQDDTGIGFSIFGDVALKAAFVVFDAGETQLGWASKKLT